MGCCEEERGVGSGFDLFVLMELGAVIRGDGTNRSRLLLDKLDGAFVQLTGGSGFEFADQGVFGFALDQGHDTVVVTPAHDGVDFPVPDPALVFGTRWSIGDVAFAG